MSPLLYPHAAVPGAGMQMMDSEVQLRVEMHRGAHAPMRREYRHPEQVGMSNIETRDSQVLTRIRVT